MIDGSELPDAIQWHEGMLLAPQHFQQADVRSEELTLYHVGLVAPFHWGVRRLGIDPRSLASGILHVTALEAILPDGALITDPLQVDLGPFAEEIGGRGVLRVHIAIPTRRKPDDPIAGTVPRYVSVEGRAVADELLGERAVSIPRIRPAATLLVTDTPAEKFTSFPLVEVHVQQGNFSLGDYVPPLLTLDAAPFPNSEVSELAMSIREKAKYLSDKIRAASSAANSDKARELQATVEKLFAGLPELDALLSVPTMHPFALYQRLNALAGRLAGLTPGLLPNSFEPYNHNDLRRSFTQVLEFCQGMVESVEQAYEAIPFQFERDAFRLRMKVEYDQSHAVIGAVGAPGSSESSLLSWVMESRIGTTDRMRSIEERRIRGAARENLEEDADLGLVPSTGMLLFRIDLNPEFVTPGEELLLSHPAELQGRERPQEIVFYAPDQSRR